VFEATACTQGSDWKAAWGCTRNDPVDRVLIVGSSKASTARGTAVLIATFTLQVKSSFTDAQLSPISGNIEEGAYTRPLLSSTGDMIAERGHQVPLWGVRSVALLEGFRAYYRGVGCPY